MLSTEFILNINRLEFDKHMACFVTSKMVSLYTTTFLPCELGRQHIYSSFTGLAPVLCYFSRAPSLKTYLYLYFGSYILSKIQRTTSEHPLSRRGPNQGLLACLGLVRIRTNTNLPRKKESGLRKAKRRSVCLLLTLVVCSVTPYQQKRTMCFRSVSMAWLLASSSTLALRTNQFDVVRQRVLDFTNLETLGDGNVLAGGAGIHVYENGDSFSTFAGFNYNPAEVFALLLHYVPMVHVFALMILYIAHAIHNQIHKKLKAVLNIMRVDLNMYTEFGRGPCC
jgi:hypothetical protein